LIQLKEVSVGTDVSLEEDIVKGALFNLVKSMGTETRCVELVLRSPSSPPPLKHILIAKMKSLMSNLIFSLCKQVHRTFCANCRKIIVRHYTYNNSDCCDCFSIKSFANGKTSAGSVSYNLYYRDELSLWKRMLFVHVNHS